MNLGINNFSPRQYLSSSHEGWKYLSISFQYTSLTASTADLAVSKRQAWVEKLLPDTSKGKQSIYQRQSYQKSWDLGRPAEKTHLPHTPRCASSLHCCKQTFQTQTCATHVATARSCGTWEARSWREIISPAFIHFHGCYICLPYI